MVKNFAPYNEPHQSRERAPDAYEDLLGDALEDAFGQHIHDIEGVVDILRARAVPAPAGDSWSPELLKSELARLGA